MGLDAATKREIPRSYVSHLEARIAALEGRLGEAGVDFSDISESSIALPGSIGAAGASPGVSGVSGASTALKPSSNASSLPTSTIDLMDNVETASRASHSSTGTQDLSFAKLLLTAVKLRSKGESSNPTAAPTTPTIEYEAATRLPNKQDAEKRLSQFFCQANSQIPIFHRELFLERYFMPIYGPFSEDVSLASDYTTVEVKTNKHQETIEQPQITAETPPIPLYFLFMVFGCATSVHQQLYPAGVSESYQQAAMQHLDVVFASPNRLEALQAMLVLCLFSIMRPTVPGVWYTLSMALRLSIDLGLHTESNQRRNGIELDAFDVDMRRRLFWCTYMLDRQICVYLGRPFGIPEDSIKVPFFSELDDSLIVPKTGVDYSLTTSPGGVKSYKYVALAFVRMRQIQAEIQRMMFEYTEVPRRFPNFAAWFEDVKDRLDEWMNSCPSTSQQTNCGFTSTFFALNYHQSRLLLYGVGPRNPAPSDYSLECVMEASRGIMTKYHALHQIMSINYTWVAVHNLFIAGTCFLYAVYNSVVAGLTLISREDYESVSRQCVVVLDSLIGRCNAAKVCHDTFELLSAAIFKMCFKGNHIQRKVSKHGLADIISNHDRRFSHLGALVEQVPDNWNADTKRKRRDQGTSISGNSDHLGPSESLKPAKFSPNEPIHAPIPTSLPPRSPVHLQQHHQQWEGPLEGPDLDDFFKHAGVSGSQGVAVPPSHPPQEMTASLEEPFRPYYGESPQEDLFSLISEVPLGGIWDQYFKPEPQR